VDPGVDVLYGPNPLQKSGTVTIPRELLREVGLEFGDKVHWVLNPDIPGTLVLIPSMLLGRSMDEVLKAIRRIAT
jgi:antitoxin component of MazEF toxin-antitoxin module